MEKTTFLSRVVPGSFVGQVVLFFLLPVLLLLATSWVILLQPSPLAPYLCGLLLFGSVMGCKYGKRGLLISEAALIAAFFFKHTGFTFYEIALCCAIAVDFFITFLAMGEIRSTLSTLVVESKNSLSQYLAKTQELLESSESWSKQQQTLEEEIAKWKEEAAQRKIDLVATHEKMQLIQSEIEMLIGQKETILQEAYSVRKEAKEQLSVLKVQMAEVELARKAVALNEELAQKQKLDYQSRIAAVEEQLRGSEKEMELKQAQIVHLEAELVDYKGRLAEPKRLEESEITKHQERVAHLEAELVSYKSRLEESNVPLEAELASYRSRLAELEKSPEKTREYAQLEGLYKQLRSQFEDKSTALTEARRELFQTETKLQALELERKLATLTEDHEEAVRLGKELLAASEECEALEEEVIALEALISHILSR